jgi:hypothetical protein
MSGNNDNENDINEINREQYWRFREKCSQISMGFKKGL